MNYLSGTSFNKKELLSITEEGLLLWNENLYVETITNSKVENIENINYYYKIYRIGYDSKNHSKVKKLLDMIYSYKMIAIRPRKMRISHSYEVYDTISSTYFGILQINIRGDAKYYEIVESLINNIKNGEEVGFIPVKKIKNDIS